ncbi:DUF2179 domain-containing protein [Flexithrix dorotheae]|uniref:DUF2179 domain-containing protein n=1 Tax=Flexithrix dorotheae TaxID=70993 RepID=UPI0003640F15|nr:DUF2179 domain-containing protein [Flexithrix dorotheae]
MQSAFAETLGISPVIFHWVILPILIFLARICDVSINTVRVIFMLSGKRLVATLLGFFESAIWLIAISQILQNIGSVVTYLAYAGGFAMGIYAGMLIEERMALGKVIVRIITQIDAHLLIEEMEKRGYGVTSVDAKRGKSEDVNIIFTVVKRKNVDALVDVINEFNPNAFYTLETLKYASQNHDLFPLIPPKKSSFIRSLIRK